MNLYEYMEFSKSCQQQITQEVLDAITEQQKLHDVVLEKRKIFDELQDESYRLIEIGTKKLFETHPEFEKFISKSDNKMDMLKHALKNAIDNTEEYNLIISNMKEIPEWQENERINIELPKALYEYFIAFKNLNNRIESDREKLFSSEYLKKMDELADSGTLLYFLETPDLPILDEKITEKEVLDSLYFNDGIGLDNLLYSFFSMDSVGKSMERKLDDLIATSELLKSGFYRAATRNLFALLDSEHKKCASAFEGIFEKKKIFKKGTNRAEKIKSLIDDINIDWQKNAWNKINNYYKSILSTKPVEGIIHRNTIVHGDYENEIIDVNKYDAMKLMLLWVNMRLVADYICNLDELFNWYLDYLPSIVLELAKKSQM